MNVAGKNYRTVWSDGHFVFYIEQNLLPFQFIIRSVSRYQDCCKAIRSMEIRGAGAIGAMAGFAMALAFKEAPGEGFLLFVRKARIDIESTRPTARNLFYAVEKVYTCGLISRDEAMKEAQRLADKDAEDSRQIGEFGLTLIKDGFSIETHCNAGWLAFVDYGTALSPVYLAHKSGMKVFVYADETRPRGQGARLTAWELEQAGIPHVIIPDNAGAALMAQGKVNIMITGADRIAANGDTANKIGTFEKAVVARTLGVPFYIAAPTSTFDLDCKCGDDIIIEDRSPDEVLYQEGMDEQGEWKKIRVCSPGSTALNPAFDVTPSAYITGIITEKGIIRPCRDSILELFT